MEGAREGHKEAGCFNPAKERKEEIRAMSDVLCRECGKLTPFNIGDENPEEISALGEAIIESAKRLVLCPECEAEKKRSVAMREQKEADAARESEKQIKLQESRLPALYCEDWDMSKGNNQLLEFVRQNADKSMFICSTESGICKTRAVCAIGFELANCGCRLEFWKSTVLSRTLTALYGTSVSEADALMSRLSRLDVLIIDDLCKEKLTDRAGELLFDLIDERFSQRRRTWVTANFGGPDLEERFGERGAYLRRRIREGFVFWSPETTGETR